MFVGSGGGVLRLSRPRFLVHLAREAAVCTLSYSPLHLSFSGSYDDVSPFALGKGGFVLVLRPLLAPRFVLHTQLVLANVS